MGCNNNFRNYNNSNFMREQKPNNCIVEQRVMCNYQNNIDDMPIAMAYVPWQRWSNVYDLDKGFCYGTIFPELNKPFVGRCMK